MAVCTYVGSRYFTWEKEGKVREGTNVYLVREFEPYEAENTVGQCVVEEYVSRDFRPELEGLCPGERVIVSYAKGFKGQAVLDALLPVPAGKK